MVTAHWRICTRDRLLVSGASGNAAIARIPQGGFVIGLLVAFKVERGCKATAKRYPAAYVNIGVRVGCPATLCNVGALGPGDRGCLLVHTFHAVVLPILLFNLLCDNLYRWILQGDETIM